MGETLGSMVKRPAAVDGRASLPARTETRLQEKNASPVGWTIRAKVSGVVGVFEFPGGVTPTEAQVFLRGIDEGAEFETELVYKRQWGEKKSGELQSVTVEGRSGKALVSAMGRDGSERMVKADVWSETGKIWETLAPLELMDHEISAVRQAADGHDTAILMRMDQGIRFHWIENERDGKTTRKLDSFEAPMGGGDNGSKADGV